MTLDIKIEHYTTNDSPNAMAVDICGYLKIWYSYETPVAFWTYDTGLVVCHNIWTRTTGKHINAISPDKERRVIHTDFLKQLYDITMRIELGFIHSKALELWSEVHDANEKASE